jgi:mono/diheme cytochrome c family protein
MTKTALEWLMIVPLTVGLVNAAAAAQDTDAGKLLFRSSCASCHGIDGKGQGPLRDQLKVAPSDLTVLSRKNGGVFPVGAMYEIIDGRTAIAAHGTREMPVWGTYTSRLLPPSDTMIDPSYDPEAVVRARILAIIDYLNRIQEK